MPFHRYDQYNVGFTTEQPLSVLALELACYRIGHGIESGGLGRAGHFRKAAELLWGDPKGKHFVWHPWAEKMNAVCHEHPVTGAPYPHVAISGAASVGKCLAPDTPVLMFDGSVKPAKQIRVGDQLMGDDPRPRHVLSTNTGRSNMVRIVPVKGDPWECNDDHILCLKRKWAGKKAWRRVGDIQEISVKDYLAKGNTFKHQRGLYCVGVEFPEQPVEFHPRAYGIWLGDGSTGRPMITSHDREVQVNGFLTDYFSKLGYKVVRQVYGKKCPCYSISFGRITNGHGSVASPFCKFVKESSPNGVKRILPRYLFNSKTIRMHVLAGIIDADGYAGGTHFEVCSSYPGLTKDITFLARSLGFRVKVTPRIVKCKGKRFVSNRIIIMGDVCAIPTLRKTCRRKTLRVNSDCTGFRIEQKGESDWCGFTIDGNGRFLLGDFTVTHNTDYMAVYGLLNWMCDPIDTLVLCTSTDLKASRKRIWGSIVQYYQPIASLLPAKLVDSMGILRTDDGSGIFNDKSGIALIAGEKKKEKEAIGKLIGAHNKRVILLADELCELTEAILTAAFSNLTTNPFFQMIGAANFKSRYDPFGIFSAPVGGWDTVTVEDAEWETSRGWCLHFDGMKSPNITGGKDEWPIYGSKQLAQHKKDLGNSAEFWRMCRSFEAPLSLENVIYSESDLAVSNANSEPIWLGSYRKLAGVDPSFSNGGDRFILWFARLGLDSNGVMILYFDRFLHLFDDALKAKVRTRAFQMADQIKEHCTGYGVEPGNFAIDVTAAQTSQADVIEEVWGRGIHRVDFSGGASDRVVSHGSPKTAAQLYVNRVSELWYSGLEFLKTKQIKGIKIDQAREMKARHYETFKGADGLKIKVEAKKDMKVRLGFSPDIADAGFVVLDLARQLGFTAGHELVSPNGWHSLWRKKAIELHSVYDEPLIETF